MEEARLPPQQLRRGVPPMHDVPLAFGENGRELEVVLRPPGSPMRMTLDLVHPVGFFEFDKCPICLTPGPTDKEHVPQRSLGGHVRTRTCAPCNNGLGSQVEGHLQDWFDGATRGVRVAGDGAPGLQAVPRVLHRQTPDGAIVEVYEVASEAASLNLRQGGLEATYTPPVPARYRAAALKHAYLAACCALERILEGAIADEIRAELVAARDAPRDRPFPFGRSARQLELLRTVDGPSGPSLALVSSSGSGSARSSTYVSLCGVVLVGWLFDELD